MLKNLVALVTGGAGSLGFATVKKLIENKCKVMIFDLPPVKEPTFMEGIKDNALFYGGDVTSTEDVTEVYKIIKQEFGRLDVIVNCAAIAYSQTIYNPNRERSASLEQFEKLISTNVTGTFNVIRLGAPLMVNKEPDDDGLKGVIINTSGFGGKGSQLGQSLLGAGWGAIQGMTMPLCRDLGPFGIRVMTIAPGLMESNLTNVLPPKVIKFLSVSTPSPKRMGKPEEYANLVMSIIGNPYLNGESIRLDGGLRLMY